MRRQIGCGVGLGLAWNMANRAGCGDVSARARKTSFQTLKIRTAQTGRPLPPPPFTASIPFQVVAIYR